MSDAKLSTTALGQIFTLYSFPLGAAYRIPNDKLNKAIVAPMLSNSPLRDRLTAHCFISADQTELPHRLDTALSMVDRVEACMKKIASSVKSGALPSQLPYHERVNAALDAQIIGIEDAKLLTEFEALRQEIIKVNEFSFDLEQVLA